MNMVIARQRMEVGGHDVVVVAAGVADGGPSIVSLEAGRNAHAVRSALEAGIEVQDGGDVAGFKPLDPASPRVDDDVVSDVARDLENSGKG